jgi:hypothetical protein
MHQPTLADRRHKLLERKVAPARGKLEPLATGCHRARADQHNLDTLPARFGDLAGQLDHARPVQMIAAGGQHVGAKLDHQAAADPICCRRMYAHDERVNGRTGEQVIAVHPLTRSPAHPLKT